MSTAMSVPRDGNAQARPRRTTIQDVAASAGVSVSAVSKVLREAYGVSPAMRDKVTAAIETLGYRPNAGARAMRGRSFTIGIVLAELTSPFQPEVAQGIANELDGTPYQAIIVTGTTSADRQRRSIEALLDRQVDGLILVAPWLDVAVVSEVATRVPLVTIALHGPAKNFDTVVDDDHLGGELVVDHLVALGHRNIMHTSMPRGSVKAPFMLSHTARQNGYEQAMRRHGLAPSVVSTHLSEEGGYRAAAKALDSSTPPTAIFAGADIAALGVLRAAEERGLQVPEDLSIVGYDNIYVSSIERVSLSTVDQSGGATGAVSARLLLERIMGRTQPVRYVLAPSLLPRNTSSAPAGVATPGEHTSDGEVDHANVSG